VLNRSMAVQLDPTSVSANGSYVRYYSERRRVVRIQLTES
jgi:hypothetical protein